MVKVYDPFLLETDVWTGKADADALEPLRERHAEIHRGSRRRCIEPLEEAGYSSAIVTTEPDPTRPLQSSGVHTRHTCQLFLGQSRWCRESSQEWPRQDRRRQARRSEYGL